MSALIKSPPCFLRRPVARRCRAWPGKGGLHPAAPSCKFGNWGENQLPARVYPIYLFLWESLCLDQRSDPSGLRLGIAIGLSAHAWPFWEKTSSSQYRRDGDVGSMVAFSAGTQHLVYPSHWAFCRPEAPWIAPSAAYPFGKQFSPGCSWETFGTFEFVEVLPAIQLVVVLENP